MEIVLKTKQRNNTRFRFLTYGHRLNPFYKLVLSMMRDGSYTPAVRTRDVGVVGAVSVMWDGSYTPAVRTRDVGVVGAVSVMWV